MQTNKNDPLYSTILFGFDLQKHSTLQESLPTFFFFFSPWRGGEIMTVFFWLNCSGNSPLSAESFCTLYLKPSALLLRLVTSDGRRRVRCRASICSLWWLIKRIVELLLVPARRRLLTKLLSERDEVQTWGAVSLKVERAAPAPRWTLRTFFTLFPLSVSVKA